MRRFEIQTPTEVKCVKFQTRSEHHGETLVTAMDLRVMWKTKAPALAMLHPDFFELLMSALPDGHSTQGELALAQDKGRNFVRFKDLKYPLIYQREFTGWMLRVDFGVGDPEGEEDDQPGFAVPLCKLHNFHITPENDEMVVVEWTISSSADLTEEFVGHMGMQQQKNIFISLLGPNKTEGDAAIDASNGSGAPGTKAAESPNNTDATKAFIAAHTNGDGTPKAAEGATKH